VGGWGEGEGDSYFIDENQRRRKVERPETKVRRDVSRHGKAKTGGKGQQQGQSTVKKWHTVDVKSNRRRREIREKEVLPH